MGYNNGTYTRNHNFSADASANIKIIASRQDTEWDDLASALTNVVWTRDGNTVPTANIPMGGRRHINVAAAVSVNNYMRVREFIENVPIFMQDQESSADRISVSAQYFTSVSANQAPGDGTRILVRAGSDKASAVMYLNGHSANVEFQDGNRAVNALVSGGVYEMIFSSADAVWKVTNPNDGRTAAERAASVTPTNYQYEPGDVRRYGAVGDGVTNDATAIQAAIDQAEAGGHVYVPAGTYLITSQLSIADATPIKFYGDGPKSIIKKGFNGDMLSLGLKSEITGVYLDGNGANFTGRGIIIETGSGGDGWQNIHDMTILDTASHCIEYTAAGAGWASRIVSNRLGVYNRPAVYAIKMPASGNGPRLVSNNVTLGPLCDMNGCESTQIIGNIGGEDASMTVPTITMSSDSQLCLVVGNQFECNTQIEIVGDRNVFVGNMMREGYTLESGATSCIVIGNYGSAALANFDTDNSGSVTNEVWGISHTYTPTVTASGTAFSLGDGTISGRWQRSGRRVHLQIDLLMGSMTSFGTGTYTISLPSELPAPTSGTSIGVIQCIDSGTTVEIGVPVIPASGGIQMQTHGSTNSVGATHPFTWAAGDRLRLDATYNL